jgi:homoserine kinase
VTDGELQLHAASVRVPCSTSNLGSGFDVLGLALDRYLEASFEPGGSEIQLERSGTLSGLEEPAADDFVVRSFRSVLEAHGVVGGGLVRAKSAVPLARGLGSSAMALVAGAALARAALKLECSRDIPFQAASEHEGHGDNAAPCAYGGLQAVAPGESGPRVIALPLSPDVGFAYAAPAARVSTEAARGVLPTHVAHPTAVLGHGRFAALLQGCTSHTDSPSSPEHPTPWAWVTTRAPGA